MICIYYKQVMPTRNYNRYVVHSVDNRKMSTVNGQHNKKNNIFDFAVITTKENYLFLFLSVNKLFFLAINMEY